MRVRVPYDLVALFFLACQTFDNSPTVLEAERQEPHLNEKNLERIAALAGTRLQGKIAVMADTHLFYNQLRAGFDKINSDSSIDFVVVAGDVTKYPHRFRLRLARVRIRFFDDNARGIADGVPDWEWLDSAMSSAGDSLRIIPV